MFHLTSQKGFKTKTTLTNPGQFNIYVPPNKKEVVKKGKDILEREGTSLSKFIVEKIEEYVRLHEPGNPQQRLDTIAKLGKPYRADAQQCSICGETAIGKAKATNGWQGLLCQRHYEQSRDARLLRKWKQT